MQCTFGKNVVNVVFGTIYKLIFSVACYEEEFFRKQPVLKRFTYYFFLSAGGLSFRILLLIEFFYFSVSL